MLIFAQCASDLFASGPELESREVRDTHVHNDYIGLLQNHISGNVDYWLETAREGGKRGCTIQACYAGPADQLKHSGINEKSVCLFFGPRLVAEYAVVLHLLLSSTWLRHHSSQLDAAPLWYDLS